MSPSRPDPCLFFICVLLFSFVRWVSSTPCSLFLVLSLRRWGNPNLFGLGFPLCSLLPARGLRLRPVLPPLQLHPGYAQPLFFVFFFVAVARSPVRMFLGFGHVGVGFLGGCLVFGLGRLSMLDVLMHLLEIKVGGQDIPRSF